MILKNIFFTTILAVVFLLPLAFVFAHSSGQSFEAQSGAYTIDIGYNVSEFSEDTSAVFNFDILEDEQSVDFTDVWVRITRDERTVFASGVHNADLGGALMTYVFPSSGAYELSVRFQNDGAEIGAATFPLVVEKSDTRNLFTFEYMLLGALGLIIGFFGLQRFKHTHPRV